jgi:hypothetical protein
MPHAGLQTIGTGCRQHFVDPKNAEWMKVDADVVCLGHALLHVTVRTDTGRFQSFT